MKEREGARKHKDKGKEKGDSDFNRICNSIGQLTIVIEVEGGIVVWGERPGKFEFFFASWQAYCASNPGEKVDMGLISQHIRGILERNTIGCANREENCFFSPFYSSSITGVCLHDSRMSHELFWASWNAYHSQRRWTCSLMLSVLFFSTACRGTWMWRWPRKEGFGLKPVGRTGMGDCWLTVWSLMTSGAGPCRLATQRCLIENNLLRWLNQG